jgi:hypothetical protein
MSGVDRYPGFDLTQKIALKRAVAEAQDIQVWLAGLSGYEVGRSLTVGATGYEWSEVAPTTATMVALTQADYDLLAPPSADVLYVITDAVAGQADDWLQITQAEYDGITPDPSILYIVID